MAEMYLSGEYVPMERDAYIKAVAKALTLLPADVVICRLTGDGYAESLLAPMYSTRKTSILNDIDTLMYKENLWQGKFFEKPAIKSPPSVLT